MAYKSKDDNREVGLRFRKSASVAKKTKPPLSPHIYSATVRKWEKLYDIFCKDFPEDNTAASWLFRGHHDSTEPLRTSLEKDLCNITGNNPKDEIKVKKLLHGNFRGASIWEIEKGLIRRFKRQYHHFDVRLPDANNHLEWLSIMRHYGAPIRMLDWSYSFFVAVFFAIEDCISNSGAVIWALDKNTIIAKAKELKDIGDKLKRDEDIKKEETWQKCFYCPDRPQLFVFPTNPFRLNERLVIQQGDLLCQGNISRTFEENLAAVLPPFTDKGRAKLRKYILKFNPQERQTALLALHRMNINRATLFPGLDGFSKSLKTLMASPKKLLYSGEECSKNDKSK